MDEKQVIELYESKNQLICAAIDRVVVEIFNKKKDGNSAQTVLMTGCSPLSGTTTLCIDLCIALANAKWKTLLIDCDLRKSLKYKKLSKTINAGLSNYLNEDNSLENVVYTTNIDNLSYIPCGDYSDNSTRLLCNQNMNELIESVKNEYDYIIFDCPSLTVAPDAQILFGETDGIILVAASGETTKNQIREAKRKVKNFEDNYYGIIVNKLDRDMYRRNLKDYDYYFVNSKGEQKLRGNRAKKYRVREDKEVK